MKILKYAFVALFVLYLLGKILGAGREPLTAAKVVSEGNKTMSYPVDLGDGLRLDGVRAEGNAMVSTVTLMDTPPGPVDAALIQVMETASQSDTCREINLQRKALVDSGITIIKEYKNNAGGLITSVTIRPADCP